MIVLAQNRKVGNDINRITVEFKSGTLFVKSGSAFILIESQWNLNDIRDTPMFNGLNNINRITVEFK